MLWGLASMDLTATAASSADLTSSKILWAVLTVLTSRNLTSLLNQLRWFSQWWTDEPLNTSKGREEKL